MITSTNPFVLRHVMGGNFEIGAGPRDLNYNCSSVGHSLVDMDDDVCSGCAPEVVCALTLAKFVYIHECCFILSFVLVVILLFSLDQSRTRT